MQGIKIKILMYKIQLVVRQIQIDSAKILFEDKLVVSYDKDTVNMVNIPA